ncbi:hypothetical protein EPICR_140021 [Candidatus Desulfarcum epimagneticum]|uniref:Uncharacterized protein n=1 Tax=uncultured Desulfobacteraceae bacterium TaxID=218296 RepID=A0A484HFP2_9BACT|nr:hypothetical protein EPICR_140021 [uncultured Desulfobacteraceae bacterium]
MRKQEITEKCHALFDRANKILGVSFMAKLWKKSHRQIYLWAADSRACENTSENPLEKIVAMIRELEKKREEKLARAFVDILASSLGYRVIPAAGALESESRVMMAAREIFSRAETMALDLDGRGAPLNMRQIKDGVSVRPSG